MKESLMDSDLIRTLGLAGKAAVVTGGGSGIGQAIARVFAEAGADVAICDLNEDGLAETVRLIEACGRNAMAVPVDVTVRDQVDGLAEKATKEFGRINVWVNCAGVIIHKPIQDVSEADVDFQIAVNMKGVYWGCAAAAREMIATGGGSIINISSTGADSASPGISVYAMTKAAVNALTRCCAKEFGPMGIRVNAIGPGFTMTPLTTVAQEPDPVRREARLKSVSNNPLGMIADPRDQALAALYLATDASRFMTGQILRPNGGSWMG